MVSLGLFLQELIRAPRTVSSLVPSSAALARAIVAGLGPQTGPVAEFGPGTGVMTQALIDAGLPPGQMTLFEVNPTFVTHLRTRFPGVHVVNAGAQTIAAHWGRLPVPCTRQASSGSSLMALARPCPTPSEGRCPCR